MGEEQSTVATGSFMGVSRLRGEWKGGRKVQWLKGAFCLIEILAYSGVVGKGQRAQRKKYYILEKCI